MPELETQSFETSEQFEQWLKSNHNTKHEVWIRIFKKNSGKPTVTWNDCIVSAIAWGWIDGVRRAFDEVSFIQRFTPRRAKSMWSKKNCEHAERLIAEGRMQPSGLAHVEAARKDGRWERAYAGSSEMTIPDDFLTELEKNPAALKFFGTLNRQNLFAIYLRLHVARSPETRKKRIAGIIAKLEHGKVFH